MDEKNVYPGTGEPENDSKHPIEQPQEGSAVPQRETATEPVKEDDGPSEESGGDLIQTAKEETSLEQQDPEEKSDWEFEGQVQTQLTLDDKIELDLEPAQNWANQVEKKEKDDSIHISKKSIKITMGVILSALLVVVFALGANFCFVSPNRSEIMVPSNVALVVDGEKISVGIYNYFYNMVTGSSNLSNYETAYGLDTSVAYDKQYYDEEKKLTWADYFKDTAIDQIKYSVSMYHQAKDAGVKLTEDQMAQIDTTFDTLKTNAASSNTSIKEFTDQNLGEYIGEKTVRKILTMSFYADNYYQQSRMDEKVTDEELEAYKKENLSVLSTVSFRHLDFRYTAGDDASMKEASDKANKFLSEKLTDDNFLAVAEGYVPEAEKQYLTAQYTGVKDVSVSSTSIPAEIMEWVASDGLEAGAVKVIDSPEYSCFFAILLTKPKSLNEDIAYSVRHALIMADTDEETGESTDAQWAEAEKKAQSLLQEWKDGEATEESFAQMAEKNSEDTGSISSGSTAGSYGGLYSGVTQGMMVAPFEEWSLDTSRKYGDTGIVKSDYGYHIMFFVSTDEGWKYAAKDAVLAQRLQDEAEKTSTKQKLGFKKTNVAQPASEG